MESVIKDYIIEQLHNSGSMSTNQHGFTKGHSCTTNLLTAFELWTSWIDAGFGVDIVDLDFRKAFDSVDHVRVPPGHGKLEFRMTIFQAWKVMENDDNVMEFLLLH